MRLTTMLLGAALVLGLPAGAPGQTTYFVDDFSCPDTDRFGVPPGIYGWTAVFGSTDPWRTDLNGGVSPATDENEGGFGEPVDDYENFLLTGHESWSDVVIEADLSNTDDDAMGLVVRYGGPGAYYACYMTKHQAAACTNPGENIGVMVALLRVDTGKTCSLGYRVRTHTTFAYTAATVYRMRMSALGDEITCEIDADNDGALGSPGDITFAYTDPEPLSGGWAGVYNFDNGEPNGNMIFDNVIITGFDPDADGDGLPDTVESALGTDPDNPDTDGDGISDRDEAGMPQYPPDSDADGTIDALELDSDGDGLPDAWEAGDGDIATKPVDTDCDGVPDYRDTDSDDDGVDDGEDNCPTVAGPQTDSDGDGVGDICDLEIDDPARCQDIDHDGCDDCGSGTFDPNNDRDAQGNCLNGETPQGGDRDGDGVGDGTDNCPDTPNAAQRDQDGDGVGDDCDPDVDGDGFYDDLIGGGSGIACRSAGGEAFDVSPLVFLLVWFSRRRRSR